MDMPVSTNKKRKLILDMANKRRNTLPARGELCPQFFPIRRRVFLLGASPFVALLFVSCLFALTPNQQRPAPVPRVQPVGVRGAWKTPRRIAPRHNSRLPVRHWWA